MNAPLCPDCRAGKHDNCDGSSYDFERDRPAPCPCRHNGARFLTGEELRDQGIAQTTEAADRQDIVVIDGAIASLNRQRKPWSANDLRDLLPEVRQPLIGARVRAAATRKQMRRVGYTPSTLPSTHAHPIAVWEGR